MARQQRNDVDYFPHGVNHGKKMSIIRGKFGNDGYAVWFMILEELGKANYHYLNLDDEMQLMYLSDQFKVDEKMLLDIVELLVKFGEFDKEFWTKSKIIWSQKFNDSIADAYKKRYVPGVVISIEYSKIDPPPTENEFTPLKYMYPEPL